VKPRRTRQLDAVAAAVQQARDHPTAAEVYARVRQTLPRTSLGTVYRNLDKLVADGRVATVHLGRGSVRYDGMVDVHDHFVCDRCGRITDLAAQAQPAVDMASLRRRGFGVRTHRLAVYGLCAGCRAVDKDP
jgi:Fe2+ or Zn2+ uptake regulation protein